MTSGVAPTRTSKLSPLRSLESASSIVSNVVNCTLHLYFLAKALTQAWLMYAVQMKTWRVASRSCASPGLIAVLPAKIGHCTGLFGPGSGRGPAPGWFDAHP